MGYKFGIISLCDAFIGGGGYIVNMLELKKHFFHYKAFFSL